jgi:hypothetical protein
VSNSSYRSKDSNSWDDTVLWPPGIEAIAEEAMPGFLLRQRWYPAKNAGVPVVALAALLPLPVPGTAAAVSIWHVTPPGQAHLYLFVPIALIPAAQAEERQTIASPDPATRLVEAFSTADARR